MNNFNNLSDDEFDALFRQSAEERNIDFDEGAWQKMNNLLDKKQPLPKTSNYKKTASIAILLLLLLSFGVFLGDQKTGFISNSKLFKGRESVNISEKANNKTINQNPKDTEKLQEETSQNLKNSEDKFENEIKNQTEISKNTEVINENIEETDGKIPSLKSNNKDLKNSELTLSEKNIGTNQITKTTSNSKQKLSKPNLKKVGNGLFNNNLQVENNNIERNRNEKNISEKVTKKFINNDQNVAEENEAEPEKTSKLTVKNATKNQFSKTKKLKDEVKEIVTNLNQSNEIQNRKKLINKEINSSTKNDIEIDETLNNIEKPLEEKNYIQNISLNYLVPKTKFKYSKPTFVVEVSPLDLELPEAPVQEYFKKGLSVRLAISPDLSRVGANKIDKIGSNLGALIEYRINKKFSVQTGVIRSMKYYDAYPDQYKWIWGYTHAKLNQIIAKCNMLDFPLNIRYDMLSLAKTRLFANGGISTYSMMKENYHYDYVDNTSSYIKIRDWEGKTGTYYASNLNISIGFEKYLNKNLTIQVEPFMKSPLKSIGFGKVPIISFGTMFSAKYPLINLKRK